MVALLKEHEKCSEEVRQHRGNINELDFLLKQVQKEIKGLKSKGTGCEMASNSIKRFYRLQMKNSKRYLLELRLL